MAIAGNAERGPVLWVVEFTMDGKDWIIDGIYHEEGEARKEMRASEKQTKFKFRLKKYVREDK